MNDTTVTLGVDGATQVVRRSLREMPTARWTTSVGADGRPHLSMQWTVTARPVGVRRPQEQAAHRAA